MKKLAGLFLALTMMITLAACAANQEDPETASNSQNQELAAAQGANAAEETSAPESGATGDHILIAYFSWADNAEITGEVDAVASPSVTEPGFIFHSSNGTIFQRLG